MEESLPAILGGEPKFEKSVPIIRPNYDKFSNEIIKEMKAIIDSNMVTNVNNYVKRFEDKIADYLKIDHVVAVNSCTLGMILSLQAVGSRDKEIILPSLSFSASAHMAYWNNSAVQFVDIDPYTWNLIPEDVEEKVNDKTGAILAVHLYGNPADINRLAQIATENDIPLLFDAAHSLGSKYKGKHVSEYGFIHSYSLSPTKLLSTIEGGLVTTNEEEIAEKIRVGRNYGNYPDYTCKLPGFNARMSELYAAVGLAMVDTMDEFTENRNSYVNLYYDELKDVKGIQFQSIKEGNFCAYKDYSIVIDETDFGLNRDQLAAALKEENISTKFYFYPPIHQLEAYADFNNTPLPITEKISNNVISLPIYNYMENDVIIKICKSIKSASIHSEKIKEKLV